MAWAQEQGYDAVVFYDAKGGGGAAKSFVAFESNQIKSATDNTGAFDGGNADVYHQSAGTRYNKRGKVIRDEYTIDLFGVPIDTGADTSAEGHAEGRADGPLSRDDAPGTYAARTEIVQESTRELGTDQVNTPQEAAQALAYLSKSAVERFDALITDANGRPLAIVGAFKGAVAYASVPLPTLVAEAFRVNGAANIWFAHNHPSGTNELSSADRQLHAALTEAFRGSEIQPRGIFAIAGKGTTGRHWVYEPSPQPAGSTALDTRGETSTPSTTATVPVVERVFTQEDRLGPPITSINDALSGARSLSGGESGVMLLARTNAPLAFVPVDPAASGDLRQDGRMDALYRALSMANAGAAILVNNGALSEQAVQNLAGFFHSSDVRVLDVIDIDGAGQAQSRAATGNVPNNQTFQQTTHGSFNPATLNISLLANADSSTFLHETGHFFLEMRFDMAARMQAAGDPNAPGAVKLARDTQVVLDWFGLRSLDEWFGLSFEEKRPYHERFARGFEAYLMEGKAPSFELQGVFRQFRGWLLRVYKQLTALDVPLTDDVRGVFDRMLATNEQITLAEQGRSMMPMFTSLEQSGMSPQAYAAYQAQYIEQTLAAVEDLQARGVRDMQWLKNTRLRAVKQLQRQARAQRAQIEMEVRREVLSQPLYRAWQFLTRRITDENEIPPLPDNKGSTHGLDESRDSLFTAIAKLGGIDREAARAAWGLDPKERIDNPVFGKPVLRKEGGRSIDAMADMLAQYGYLPLDEHGAFDPHDFEDRFLEELRGAPQLSMFYDYAADVEIRAGDQAAAPLELTAGRLDGVELRAMLPGADVVEALQKRGMVAKNGLHPDLVAEIVGGFTSGDELVKKLAAATPPQQEIDALTDMRMLEEYGDLASPEAIERAADKAIHNDARARFVAAEANALAKAVGKRGVLLSAAKEFAAATVDRLKVRDIRPYQYTSAAARAGKAADAAFKKGDVATAAAEKRNQVLQGCVAQAAYDAQDAVDTGLRYLKRFDDGRVKNLDADYMDQIDTLLERFDLRKGQSLKAIDKRASLEQWLLAQEELGYVPDIPEALRAQAHRTSYKNLTVEEFRGLVDAVKQIEHLGRLKNRMLTDAKQRSYEVVRDELAGSIHAHAQGRVANTRTTGQGRAVRSLKKFAAEHIKVATWARILDGGKDGGLMWEHFIRHANEAGDRETTMRAQATEKLSGILAPVFALGRMGGKGQFFASINRSLNRESRIALALNTGNDGNLQRLFDGEGWTWQQVRPVLESLTAQEWAAVQEVWDYMDSFRPMIAGKERRLYGKEPEWVQPRAFTVTSSDGAVVEMRGGYYPIVYDPEASQRADDHDSADAARRQLQGAYTSATTRRGFTKARAAEVKGRPLLLTLSGLYTGANDVIHDLCWHEWLIDTNRLLRSHTIGQAMRGHYGAEVQRQFKAWVQDIAGGDREATGAVEMALSRLRQGVSMAGLGFNVMSAAMQPLGITQSMVRIGARWVGVGLQKYMANPVALTRQVNEMSSFMENRSRTRFRELNELRNRVQDQGAFMSATSRYAYYMMMRCQQVVDTPTWWGAYEKAVFEGNDEARAIALADQAVIDAQGGGQTKDLAKVERSGRLGQLFTVFYSFMNTALNLGVEKTMSADTPAKRARLAVDYAMLYTVPAVLGYFLRNALTPGDAGDDEDMGELAKKLIAAQIDYLMGLMVVVREFSSAAKIAAGVEDSFYGYQGPAGLRVVTDAQNAAQQAMQGEFDAAFQRSAINIIGSATGLPSAQVNRTIKGAKALNDGKTSNPAALAFGFQEPR